MGHSECTLFFKKVFLGKILDKWTECSFMSDWAFANELKHSAKPLLKVVEMGDQPILSSSFPGRCRDPKPCRRKHVFSKINKAGHIVISLHWQKTSHLPTLYHHHSSSFYFCKAIINLCINDYSIWEPRFLKNLMLQSKHNWAILE